MILAMDSDDPWRRLVDVVYAAFPELSVRRCTGAHESLGYADPAGDQNSGEVKSVAPSAIICSDQSRITVQMRCDAAIETRQNSNTSSGEIIMTRLRSRLGPVRNLKEPGVIPLETTLKNRTANETQLPSVGLKITGFPS